MKIGRVVVHPLRLPLPRPLKTSIHDIRAVDTVLVELQGEGGAVGSGYCFVFGDRRARALQALVEDLVPLYEGQDASATRALFDRAWRSINFLGHAGVAVMALAALDTACWDLAAQAAGLPLWRFLGAAQNRVPTYASSGLWLDRSIDELVTEARGFLAAGHRAMKMRLGRPHDEDLARARALRAALGPDVRLLADVNQGWDVTTAIRTGTALEEIGLYWLEEPVPADDFAGYQRIAAALDMRVVGGETHFTRYDLRPFFVNPCLPILQPDPMRGGMTDLRKIAALADTFGITIAPHLFPELNVHLLASIPNGIWCENMGLIDDLWVDPPEIANGMITAPERPGHGLRFKEEVLKFRI